MLVLRFLDSLRSLEMTEEGSLEMTEEGSLEMTINCAKCDNCWSCQTFRPKTHATLGNVRGRDPKEIAGLAGNDAWEGPSECETVLG